MTLVYSLINLASCSGYTYQSNNFSPVMEEGLLIGIAIVAILIVVGILFGVFDWIGNMFNGIFNDF